MNESAGSGSTSDRSPTDEPLEADATTPGPGGAGSVPATREPVAPPSSPASEPAPSTASSSGGASGASKEPDSDPLRHSRTSGLWTAVVALCVVLVLLIIFISQNTNPVTVTFLSWRGDLPLSAALLAATVAGMLLAVVAGTLRILQLRRRVRKERRAQQKAEKRAQRGS